MQNLNNINFLRIIFTCIIIIFHLLCQPNTLYALYPNIYEHLHHTSSLAYLSVEMFFIIAGFFLYHSAKKNINIKHFFINKWIRLWCVPAFAIFSIWILSLFNITCYNKYANILHLFMLKNTGLTLCLADNGTTWFVSVLFWVSIFYFYLIKNFDKKYVDLIIALIIFCSFSLLVNAKKGHFIAHYDMITPIFNVGMLRGLAEIGVGYFIAKITKNYVIEKRPFLSFNFKNKSFWICSVLEIYLLLFVVQRFLIKFGDYTNDLFWVIILSLIFVLFLLKKGVISILTENKIFYNLGKYTFSIYVMQEVVYRILNKTFWTSSYVLQHPIGTILISLLITCFCGIIVYYLIENPATHILNKIHNRQEYTDSTNITTNNGM